MKKIAKTSVGKTSGEDLKYILKVLKLYKQLKNSLGKRGIGIFQQKIYAQDTYKVEYYPGLDQKTVEEIAIKTYLDIFQKKVSKENILFIEREQLEGGMRMYKNHEMVDISLSRIRQFLEM